MKILIVSRSYYPLNTPRSFRTTELAREFARSGHEVTVVTHLSDETIEFSRKNNIRLISISNRTFKSFSFFSGTVGSILNRIIGRILLKFFDYPNIQYLFHVRKILKALKGYDLLITIATPHSIHWGVSFVKPTQNQIASTWIADCGDPYMGSQSDTFKPAFYFKYLEKRFCRRADYITVPTSNSVLGYYREFHKKIRVIPQGFDFSEVQQLPDSNITHSVLSFAYAGTFIPGLRDPKKFIEYLLSLDVDFRFFIYTKTPYSIPEFSKKSNGRIILCNPLPRLELLQKLKEVDFLINFENAGITETPSKLIDYALIEKPILSVGSKNIDTDNINKFLNKNYSGSFSVSDLKKYDIKNVALEFIKLCPK